MPAPKSFVSFASEYVDVSHGVRRMYESIRVQVYTPRVHNPGGGDSTRRSGSLIWPQRHISVSCTLTHQGGLCPQPRGQMSDVHPTSDLCPLTSLHYSSQIPVHPFSCFSWQRRQIKALTLRTESPLPPIKQQSKRGLFWITKQVETKATSSVVIFSPLIVLARSSPNGSLDGHTPSSGA